MAKATAVRSYGRVHIVSRYWVSSLWVGSQVTCLPPALILFTRNSFAPYAPYVYPYDLGNSWPFTEISTVWNMFHSSLPMPKDARSPISITYNGQMMLSRATIRKTSSEVWGETLEILVSEVNDPRHVLGFAWKAEEEGQVAFIYVSTPC